MAASGATSLPATRSFQGTDAEFFGKLEEFWNNDFGVLEAAGNMVLQSLRDDEAASDADLYRRINSSINSGASHLYFHREEADSFVLNEKSAISALPSFKLLESVPLPPLLSEKFQSSLTAKSRMGLLQQANLAWMSLDNQLYLWSYDRSPQRFHASAGGNCQGQDYCSWKIPQGQSILTVGIATPKKGVFQPHVEWCLLVTTTEQAILCALARYGLESNAEAQGFAHGKGILRLIPTRFVLNVGPIGCAASTLSGRIFLGGKDGHLYEMDYVVGNPSTKQSPTEQLDEFYDGGKEIPDILNCSESRGVTQTLWAGSKRIFEQIRSPSSCSPPPKKCRKLDHSSDSFTTSRLAKAVVPEILLQATGSLLGQGKLWGTRGMGHVTKIVIDEERSCLYTLSSLGWIASFDLILNKFSAVMNVAKSVRLYLDAVARGSMYPPIAGIIFPGGGVAAQAGVGGMDGARAILKFADLVEEKSKGRGASTHSSNILAPEDLHVVSRKESSRLTLIAISKGGLRYYISSLKKNVVTNGPSPFLGRDRKSDPLCPSNHFILCHVRAPPSLDGEGRPTEKDSFTTLSPPDGSNLGTVSLEGETAILPKVVGSPEKIPRLDASYYQDGTLILAMNAGQSTTARLPVDVIVAAIPDSSARKKLSPSISGVNPSTVATFEVAGGLAETLFLPLHSSLRDSQTDVVPSLHGGRVWCITQSPFPVHPVLSLALASQTPTDAELGVGLVPAFTPRNKLKATLCTGTRPTSQDLVASETNTRILLSKVTIRAIMNVFLSRPLRHGIYQPSDTKSIIAASSRNLYRISTRFGYNGFSTTAGEGLPSKETSPSNPKSARLRPWLLRPPIAPLNSMAIQHLLPESKMVALNSGGLYYFGFQSALVSLSESLMSAGPINGADKFVANFFARYGYKESCAMCVLLAIGFGPPSACQTPSPELRQRAIRAALARAHVPRLVDASNVSTTLRSNNVSDPMVPSGYNFLPSFLCEGICTVVARLLRPVWHKPAVVVTEGRTIKLERSSLLTSAKVELLLDDATLEEVRRPLFELQSLMKKTFSPAVGRVPGKLDKEAKNAMENDNDVVENQFLTRAMSYNGHVRSEALGQMMPKGQISQSQADFLARLCEEKNLHLLFRILSRSVQLLNMLSLLRKAQSIPSLPEIDWGLLHGITFAQLVLSREGHQRLETMLNALVTASPTNPGAAVSSSVDCDELANLFADQCYLYFSPGSRYAYFGFKFAHDALLRSEKNSTQHTLSSKKAYEYFKQAARYWCSAPLVVGGFFHGSESDSSEQKALHAMQFDSPLAKAASLLIQLDDVVGVVQTCLITGSNFGGEDAGEASSGSNFGVDHPSVMQPWEHGLYHKRNDAQDAGTCSGPAASLLSTPSSTIAVGAMVTAQDALETCHALIFHHLLTLLKSERTGLAEQMLSACVASTDRKFLHGIFSQLHQNGHTDTLLKVESVELEQWLKGHQDPDLLFRYYERKTKMFQAGEVMWHRARDPALNLPLAERVACLTRCHDCFNEAMATPADSLIGYDDLVRLVAEVRERMDVAKLQLRVLSKVPLLGIKLQEDQQSKLSTSLVDISDLYNEFASPHQMFDICLLIFQACRNNDASTIQKLWRTVIVQEILPCATRSEEVYRFLQNLMNGSLLDETVSLLSENATSSESLRLFENGEWIARVQDTVVRLGLELFGNYADYVFPVDFIVSQLEGLRQVYDLCAPRQAPKWNEPWPLHILVAVGIPYLVALDTYDVILDLFEQEGMGEADSVRRYYRLKVVVDLLNDWVSAAKQPFGDRHQNNAMEQLSNALSSSGLMTRIDSLRADLDALRSGGIRDGDVRGIILTLQSVEDTIMQFT